jgi:DNA modification methylase
MTARRPTARDVLAGRAPWALEAADCLDFLGRLPAASVDLVFGSPPYPRKGRRYPGPKEPPRLDVPEWVGLMFQATLAARRACRGDVLWVVNNPVEQGRYYPAVERLLVRLDDAHVRLERPPIWDKNAPPNRPDWFVNSHEHLVVIPAPGKRRTWNWKAIAEPPRFTAGGPFRQRDGKGVRELGNSYPKTKLARPRDVLRVTVGGGHMGYDRADDRLACENEAPFPVRLVEPFVLALTYRGAVVCDPFSGGGTVAVVSRRHGRRFVGCDVRPSQLGLTRRRLAAAEKKFPKNRVLIWSTHPSTCSTRVHDRPPR